MVGLGVVPDPCGLLAQVLGQIEGTSASMPLELLELVPGDASKRAEALAATGGSADVPLEVKREVLIAWQAAILKGKKLGMIFLLLPL